MIIQKPTPHFTVGRGGYKPEKIIIHIIDGSQSSCDSWFANPISGVSSNYSVGFNGEVHQYVKDEDTAYAQGKVDNPNWTYRLGVNPNKYCLSIEHEGTDLSDVKEAQINATVELIRSLATKWNIPINRDNIRGHYEIRITKPNCPATNKEIIDRIVRQAQQGSEEMVPLTVPKSRLEKITKFLLNL